MKSQNSLLELEIELKYRNYSPRTIEIYFNCTAYFLKYLKNDISKISKEIIIDFTLHLQSKNKAPKTINLYKDSIKFFTKEVLKQLKFIQKL